MGGDIEFDTFDEALEYVYAHYSNITLAVYHQESIVNFNIQPGDGIWLLSRNFI